MSDPKMAAAPAAEFTRKEVNEAAKRLAAMLHRFMEEAHPHMRLARRYTITAAALELEAMSDGR